MNGGWSGVQRNGPGNHETLFQALSVPALTSRGPVWIALLIWLLLATPLFVSLPLNCDTALYDVQARCVLAGGVAYRDVLEPNLPGALWIHMAVRSVAGWSSEMMRFADLLVVSAVLLLGCRLLPRRGAVQPTFLLAASVFYLSRNEWCHAQRDTWMMLPALMAVWLRWKRSGGGNAAAAVSEGIFWGVAFWIKPHITVPAAAVIAADFLMCSRSGWWRDFLYVCVGGLLTAVPGVSWMMASGAWTPFLDMMLTWNPEYFSAGRERMSLQRWQLLLYRFSPWPVVHLLAVPLSLSTILRIRSRSDDGNARVQVLCAACCLGWLAQSVAMQHALDYVHVPVVILGMLVIAGHTWSVALPVRRLAVGGFATVALTGTTLLQPDQLGVWPTVWTEGSSVSVRSALAHGTLPDWTHLSRVIQFLRAQSVSNGDVACADVHSVHVYNELQIHPPTRYWCVSILQELFPDRAAQIYTAVQVGQQFVVVEDRESGLTKSGRGLDAWLTTLPLVFKSGSYRVYDTSVSRHASAPAIRNSARLSIK